MQTNIWYRIIAFIVSLTLIVQTFAPVGRPVHAAEAEAPRAQTAVSTSLNDALTVARVQSSYQAGDEITVTYAVHNNLVPTAEPNVSTGTPITDTIGILAAFDTATDANTMRNVSLATTLTAAATYRDSSLPPTQSGSTFTWTIPDIPPQGRLLLTMTVQATGSAPDFTDLDNGATVTADLWDTNINHSARPALLAPDTLAPAFTAGTVDADPFDKDLLWQTAVFGTNLVLAC